jgi:hypothetical protein
MKKTFFLFALLNGFCSQAQYETLNWMINPLLTFSISPPAMSYPTPTVGGTGSSTISDPDGNLLFFAIGNRVYNAFNQPIAPLTGTTNPGSSWQSALAVPLPGNDKVYYIFSFSTWNTSALLQYSVLNTTLTSGGGSLTTLNATLNTTGAAFGICAIRHCNGRDTWILTRHYPTKDVNAYLLTPTGINPSPVVSSAISTYTAGKFMRSSPNGRKVALYSWPSFTTSNQAGPRACEIADFDNSTGLLSNSYVLSIYNMWSSTGIESGEFSPDGSKLYLTENLRNLVQYNMNAPTPAAVIASAYTVFSAPGYTSSVSVNGVCFNGGGIQRALDGKIYLGSIDTIFVPKINLNSYMSVISNPNLPGSACNFSLHAINLGTTQTGSYPQYPNYFIKPLITYSQPNGCSAVTFTVPPDLWSYTGTGSLTSCYWIFGDPASGAANQSTLSAPTHTYSQPGTYRAKLVLNNGGCTDTIYSKITIGGPGPITVSGIKNICKSQSLTLTFSGAASYTLVNLNLPVTTTITLSPTLTTVYSVTASYTNSPCLSNTIFTVNVDLCVGVPENKWPAGTTIYPSPVREVLHIELTIEKSTDAILRICNLLGEEIYKSEDPGTEINMAQVAPGTYFVQLLNKQDGQLISTQKIIKE